MRTRPSSGTRSVLLLVAILAVTCLLVAPSCDVTIQIQFDLYDLLFGSADLLESPS